MINDFMMTSRRGDLCFLYELLERKKDQCVGYRLAS